MPWNTLTDLSSGIKVTESHMDAIRENINYLYKEGGIGAAWYSGGTLSASGAGFTAMHTDLSLTVTANGGPFLIGFNSHIWDSGVTRVYIDVFIDGTGLIGRSGITQVYNPSDYSGRPKLQNFTVMATAIATGTHTIEPRWRISGAGTAYIRADNEIPVNFWVAEQ